MRTTPARRPGAIDRFALYTLTDQAEQDNTCGGIYNKSLLYLVSNAFESRPRIPLFRDGVPLLGMQRFADAAREKSPAVWGRVAHVLAPNAEPPGSIKRSAARAHGGFDDDQPTLVSTLARILEVKKLEAAIDITGIGSDLRVRRDRWAQV